MRNLNESRSLTTRIIDRDIGIMDRDALTTAGTTRVIGAFDKWCSLPFGASSVLIMRVSGYRANQRGAHIAQRVYGNKSRIGCWERARGPIAFYFAGSPSPPPPSLLRVPLSPYPPPSRPSSSPIAIVTSSGHFHRSSSAIRHGDQRRESFTFGDQRRPENDDRLIRPERSRINPALIICPRPSRLFALCPTDAQRSSDRLRSRKNEFTTHRSTRDAGNGRRCCLLLSSSSSHTAVTDRSLSRVSSLAPSADAARPLGSLRRRPATHRICIYIYASLWAYTRFDSLAFNEKRWKRLWNVHAQQTTRTIRTCRYTRKARFCKNIYRWQRLQSREASHLSDPPLAACRHRATQLTQNGRWTLTAEAKSTVFSAGTR